MTKDRLQDGYTEQLNLDRARRERALVQTWQRGMETEDCIAYHGTGLETVKYLIEYGGIPGATDPIFKYELDNSGRTRIGDLYFLPRLATFPFEIMPPEQDLRAQDRIPIGMEEFALNDCISMAEDRAQEQFFCNMFNLDIGKYGWNAYSIVTQFDRLPLVSGDFRIAYEVLLSLGITPDEITTAVTATRVRKGIVIALKNNTLDFYPPSEGDAGDDFRIRVNNGGLPVDFISGILPLGKCEMLFFEDLAKKHHM